MEDPVSPVAEEQLQQRLMLLLTEVGPVDLGRRTHLFPTPGGEPRRTKWDHRGTRGGAESVPVDTSGRRTLEDPSGW